MGNLSLTCVNIVFFIGRGAFMDSVSILKEIDLFQGLSDGDLRMLAERGFYREVKTREALFHQGDRGSHLYLLIDGTVKASRVAFDGAETTVKIFHPGEFFGEVVIFHNDIYPVSAVALSDSRVFALQRDSLFDVLNVPAARDRFIAALFGKLRYLTDQVYYLRSHDVEERFFRYLKDTWGERYEYRVSLPRREIALAIGTIPETFSRLTMRLTKLGLIRWDGDVLTLRDGFWDERLFE